MRNRPFHRPSISKDAEKRIVWLLSSQNGLADLTGNENANQPMIKKGTILMPFFF